MCKEFIGDTLDGGRNEWEGQSEGKEDTETGSKQVEDANTIMLVSREEISGQSWTKKTV